MARKAGQKPPAKTGGTRDVFAALEGQHGKGNVMGGKGGFWIKGQGHITTAKARRATGVAAPKRQMRGRVPAYGDWGYVAALNRAMTPRRPKRKK